MNNLGEMEQSGGKSNLESAKQKADRLGIKRGKIKTIEKDTIVNLRTPNRTCGVWRMRRMTNNKSKCLTA